MCYYLSIGTSLGLEALRTLAPEGLQVREGRSPHLRRIDPSLPVWADLTDGRCSCSLSPTPDLVDKAAEEAERLAERYRKKGYSEERVERAVRAAQRGKNARKGPGPGDTTAYVLRLLERTPSVVAFCRWLDPGTRDELVRNKEQIVITLARVARVRPGWLPLDTAVRVRA